MAQMMAIQALSCSQKVLADSLSTGAAPWQVAEVSAYEGAQTRELVLCRRLVVHLGRAQIPWGWERDSCARSGMMLFLSQFLWEMGSITTRTMRRGNAVRSII